MHNIEDLKEKQFLLRQNLEALSAVRSDIKYNTKTECNDILLLIEEKIKLIVINLVTEVK